MKKHSIFLILCICAHIAQGGVIVSVPSSGWADSAWTGEEEYRCGATARSMEPASGDRELGIGSGHAMSENTGHLDWGGPGTSHSFLLDDDPSRLGRAIWAIDGQETELPNPISPFSDMYIHINNSDGQLSDLDFVLEGTGSFVLAV